MPPEPSNSIISSCGKWRAMASAEGGTGAGRLGPSGAVAASLPMPTFTMHSGHRPPGVPGGTGLPQWGHLISSAIISLLQPLDREIRLNVTAHHSGGRAYARALRSFLREWPVALT